MFIPFHDGASDPDAIAINDDNNYVVCYPYVDTDMIVSIGPRMYDATVHSDDPF